MINIIITGARGRMGRAVTSAAASFGEVFRVCAGVDINESLGDIIEAFPVYTSLRDFSGEADVIIDFSHHTAVEGILSYAVEHRMAAVIATTGHNEDEMKLIKEASQRIPVFFSRNMSIGVNLLIELCRHAAAALDGFDIEIIEKHHNKKLDAPSGTAYMIADALSESLADKYTAEYVFSRNEKRAERKREEIGIHAVRGGTIVGEHEVIFAGRDENVTISHSAASREVFAQGAIRAAAFVYGKPAGLYSMNDIIGRLL